ncbi:YciI family protein [Streptomyces sp. NPDC057950]|uniref:YciI family protein n=1 Tax=Streptomyces sp. NPDC057950 TaxID=3346288 RepID=UPI0036E372C7
MPDMNGPTYFILTQSPGPKWVEGVVYNEQPEFWTHVKYMEEIHATGNVVLSGPFMESPGGAMANGGMTIIKNVTLEEATAIAAEDPTVKSGMIYTDVKPWWIPFHD